MRLALISYEFPPETLGGIASYARHAVTALAGRGHDITIFAGTPQSTTREERWAGARVVRLPCPDRRQFCAVAVPAVAAEHRRAPFEAAEVPDLYAESAGLRQAAPTLPILLRAHTPLYIPAEIDFLALPPLGRKLSMLRRVVGGLLHHQPWPQIRQEARARSDFWQAYDCLQDPERQAALEADLVVPSSHRLAERLLSDWNLPADRVRVLDNAHEPSAELLALEPPKSAVTVTFHGGIRRFKGVHVLAAAMPRVLARFPSTRFVLAGASAPSPVPDLSPRAWLADQMVRWRDTADWLRPQFEALGPGRATFSGFIRPEALPAYLAAADICVFPSLFDNFPAACLEAMSAARPIVATRSGGMEEMLGDEEAGLLVPPGDAAALAHAICRLLGDAALRGRLATRARERVRARWSADVIVPRHEALFAEAAARRRAALSP